MYNIEVDGLGYIGPVYTWPDKQGIRRVIWKNVAGSAGCMLILVILYSGVCCFGLRLFGYIKNSMASHNTKKMNLQLLQLLLIQAVVPLFFEYIPCIMTVFGGYLGLPLSNSYSLVAPVFISGYAPMEAFVTILGFPVYRRRLFRCAPVRRIGVKYTKSQQTMTRTETVKS
ncbi:unnamed protein product, partial [Mesorhabditis spiculigera]